MVGIHPGGFGALVRRHRLNGELTQEALAERASLSVRAVRDIERGAPHVPRHDTVALLAEALGLDEAERGTFAAAARPASPITATRSASMPPLVGRAPELALLRGHVRPISADAPPLLFLAGEPGIGKTRLLAEAARLGALEGRRVLSGGCRQRGGQEPYAPLQEAVARHLASLPLDQARREVRGCAWLVRLLPELAGGPLAPLPSGTISAEEERRLTFDATTRCLANAAGAAGTLLLLDDLQWAGKDALDLLRVLAHRAADNGLRVVAAYRDTELEPGAALSTMLADLAAAGLATHHPLAPLAIPDATALLAVVLGESAKAADGAAMAARLGGVPFFLVSWAQGRRQGRRDAGGDAQALPWTVTQSVRERVAVLPAEAREALAVAAVAGRAIKAHLLARALGRPLRAVVSVLETACQARLLVDDAAGYRFAHDLIREVVESDLGLSRRTLLHLDIAASLEDEPGAPPVELLAYHYACTDAHGQAARWLEQAGDAASAAYAVGSALTHYTAARQRQESVGNAEGLSRLDEKLGDLHRVLCQYHDALATFNQAQARTAEPARRATLWCKQAEIWRTLGEHARAADAYDAAEGEGGQNGAGLPALTRAAIALGRGDLHSDMGAYGAADAAADRALHLLASAPPGPATDVLLMQAYHLQGNVAMRPWSLDRAEDRFTQLLPLTERRGDRHALAAAQMQLGRVMLSSPGKLDRAEDLIGRARRGFDEIGDQEGSARCWRGLGLVARLRRDWAAAEEAFRHSITIGEAIGYDRHVADLWGEMGILLLARGDAGAAVASYERALAIYTGQDVWEGLWGCGLALGRIALLRGNLAGAEEHATRALAIARERGETRHRAGAWHVLAQVAYERGKLGAALRLGRLARRGAQAGSGELPRVLLTLARARLAGGRPEHAAILLAHAQDCLADSPSVYRLDIELDLTLARADLALARAAVDEAEAMAPAARALVRVAGGLREEALVTMLEGRCAHAAGRVADAEERLRAALASQTALGLALDAARTGVVLAATLLAGSGSADASAEARLLLAQARTQLAASGALLDLARCEGIV